MTARFDTLSAWLATQRPGQTFTLKPASSDASFRRYFRATFADGATAIVMDAPPEHENCEPFVRVSGLLAAAGVHVPRVHAQDLQQGFLLLDDLGSTTYLAGLTEDKARALYLDAIDALVLIQQAAGGDSLPPYDEALLTREMNLFPEWFASRHLGKPFDHDTLTVWKDAQRLLLDAIQAQPRVLVHRDYHCRNLMVSQPNPGVLDFQDAVYGPLTYDLVSLLKDAYLEWPEEFILDMVIRYWEKARKAGLPVQADIDSFYRDFEWMGVQRHLKVAGIFARLSHRDGKHAYLDDIPLVVHNPNPTCKRYTELLPLGRLIQSLVGEDEQVGYTF